MNDPHPLEIRSLEGAEAEVRMAEGEGGRPVIRGYAAVFGRRSQVMRTAKGRAFVEHLRPDVFNKSLDGADVRGLINHDKGLILGRKGAGTLRLSVDSRGLAYEIDPPDTSYARDLMESLRRGDISGSSFSFATIEDDWSEGEDGLAVRELRAVHPFDVGPVTFPAYLDTTAAATRSLDLFEERRGKREVVVPPSALEGGSDAAALAQKLLRFRLWELT